MSFSVKIFLILMIINSSINSAEAVNKLSEIKSANFNTDFDSTKIKDGDGILAIPSGFTNSTQQEGIQLPQSLSESFNNEVSLLVHRAVFKIPRNYDEYVTTSLKDKMSIQENLLYNSTVDIPSTDTLEPCRPVTGDIITDINLPFLLKLKMSEENELLRCKIKIVEISEGGKYLNPQLKSKLSKDVNDKDIRHIKLHLSECNIIFKAIAQDIYFIKAADGKTLLLFENYSLVKNSTIKDLNSLQIMDPLNMINKQAKVNMTGLLKYVNSAPK